MLWLLKRSIRLSFLFSRIYLHAIGILTTGALIGNVAPTVEQKLLEVPQYQLQTSVVLLNFF